MSSTSPRRARYSRPSATRRDSSDDERSAAPLTPPRPSFLASSRDNNTNSWYSSSDPASDSDREIVPAVHPQSSSSVLAQQPPISRHARPRSTASAIAASYAPIDASDYANDESQLPQASAALRSATMLPRPLSPSDPSPPNSATATSHPLLHHQTSSTSSSYNARRGSASFPRSPPSAFPYPFQSHLGNPDPISATSASSGLRSRQNSIESLQQQQQRYGTAASSTDGGHGYINSVEPELERPYAPFMTTSSGGGGIYGSVPSPSSNEPSPRASTASFRAPFLSPASRPVSRPNSAFWSPPPTYDPAMIAGGPGTGSSTPLPGPKPPLPSTLLAEKLNKEDKPWLRQKDTRSRASYWITLLVFFVGVGVAALIVWRGYDSAGRFMIPESKLCAVFDDDFSSLDVDGSGSKWARNVSLNGFGNNEFEMTTNSDKNLFIKDGQLYIMPTLTTATGGVSYPNILDGGKYTLSGCTDSKSNCTVSSSNSSGSVIPPVQSARISTKGFAQGSIRYGKVEVSAKLPTGDWLWPAIWMLPVEEKYGAWPVSGEIDIMEARGNDISYAQGTNFVRSTLNWGPLQSVVKSLYGWQSMKQRTFADGFHTYTLEWTDQFIKMYVDSRLKAMVQVDPTKKSYWDLGDFPPDAQNGSSKVALRDPYGGSTSAPFDQAFYLIINLSVGGTSGWFPDGVGGKPWTDAEDKAAIRQFALDQATWSASWPEDEDERAFRIDSVKMWKLC